MPDIECFEFTAPAITAEDVHAFRHATRTENGTGMPLTFPTIYRRAEFQWLDHMKVDMRTLLHTEQVYHYHSSLKVGDVIQVVTRRTICKERRGMLFVTLETTLRAGSEVRVTSETQFVIRAGAGK